MAINAAEKQIVHTQLDYMFACLIGSWLLLHVLDADPTVNRAAASFGTVLVLIALGRVCARSGITPTNANFLTGAVLTTASTLLVQFPDGLVNWTQYTNYPFTAVYLNVIGQLGTMLMMFFGFVSLDEQMGLKTPSSRTLLLWTAFVVCLLIVHQTAQTHGNIWIAVISSCMLWGIGALIPEPKSAST